MGKEEYGEGQEQLMIQTHHILLDMLSACMAADRTGSLVFVEDVTADRSSRMN